MPDLVLDYANCLSDRIGDEGLDPAHLEASLSAVAEHGEELDAMRAAGETAYRDLPFDPARSAHTKAIRRLVDDCAGTYDTLIVLGIGGSALGNIALQNALNPVTYNLLPDGIRPGPRLFVVDNVDPMLLGDILDFAETVDPGLSRTLVNVISKSGETAETAAQFITMRDVLINSLGDNAHRNIIAITDPSRGTMRSIVDAEGYRNLPVPDGVGGRFSVLSPVGLFSAAMCGIDIEALLDGAASMDAPCSRRDMTSNPAAMLAFLLIEFTKRGKPNHVLMPYCNALYSLADWYRQIWAESLGKQVDRQGNEVFAGATPIKALGTTDQHSQVQLYREGPNDKVIGFVDVRKLPRDLTIPTGLDVENLKYLQGVSFTTLLAAEKRATEYALVESKRPNFTITFPTLDAYYVGQFIALWEIATSYAGLMLNINAYDQPAVELGKQATFGLMGRPGYEEFNTKVADTLGPSDRVIPRNG
ncbi:MAG: glucose-6-phosphate isomerase [Phycisphaerales bacterium]|nr:glucose-6-phosphate isomerase [Phycisphaerales bacterium]